MSVLRTLASLLRWFLYTFRSYGPWETEYHWARIPRPFKTCRSTSSGKMSSHWSPRLITRSIAPAYWVRSFRGMHRLSGKICQRSRRKSSKTATSTVGTFPLETRGFIRFQRPQPSGIQLEARIANFRRNPFKAPVPDCLQNLLRSPSIVGQKASKRWGHGCPFHVDHDKAPIKPAPASPLVDHDNPLRRHSSEDKPPIRQGVCRNQIGFLKWLRWIRDPRSRCRPQVHNSVQRRFGNLINSVNDLEIRPCILFHTSLRTRTQQAKAQNPKRRSYHTCVKHCYS